MNKSLIVSILMVIAFAQAAMAKDVLQCHDTKNATTLVVSTQDTADATITQTQDDAVIDQQDGQIYSAGAIAGFEVEVKNSRGVILNVGTDASNTLTGFYLDTKNKTTKIYCK
jgi:hypothetical protein